MSKRPMVPCAPRNPVAVAARFRRAGPHGGGIKTLRQEAKRRLRQELQARQEGP